MKRIIFLQTVTIEFQWEYSIPSMQTFIIPNMGI